MCLMPCNKAKAWCGQEAVILFLMVSWLDGYTLNSNAELRKPSVQLFAPNTPIALPIQAQHLVRGGDQVKT